MLLGATKKNISLWLLLLSVFLAPIFFSNSSFAASTQRQCRQESQAPDAASVDTACKLCFDASGNKIGSGREGAVWINTESSNSSSSQSAFVSGGEAIRNNDGTFTAYLHGSFFNCTGSSMAALNAKNIYIIQASQSSWDGTVENINKDAYKIGTQPSGSLSFIDLQGSVLDRGSNSTPSLQWSDITSSSPLALKINVEGMKAYAKQSGHACIINEIDDNESADGVEKEISQISCVVGIWRCPSSAVGITENCWANQAELVVKEFEKLTPMNVKGKVTVKDANNTSNKATTEYRTKNSVLPSCSTEFCIPFDDINNMPIQIQIKENEEAKVAFTYNLKRKSGRESDTIKYAIVSSTNTSTTGRVRDTTIISTDEPWTETETVAWPSSKGNGEICKRLDFKSPRHNVPVKLAACANITILQDDADYQAEARVKFGSNDEQSTGLQQDYTKTVKYSVEKGTTAQILFTHYGYSSLKKTEEIKWRLTVPEIPSEHNIGGRGDDRTVSSPMTIKQNENGLFTTDIRPTFQSDYGSITFNSVGTFKFCEKIVKKKEGVKGVGICLQINVTEPGDPGGGNPPEGDTDPPVLSCLEHAPATYRNSDKYTGTTSTWSYVATSDGTRSAESNGSIWAKPGDYVHFEHCYFPGAQAVRTNSDSPTHITDPTDEDRVHMPTYTTEVNGIVSNQTFDHRIGNLTKIVAGNNRFEINTSRYDLLSGGNNIHFSVTGSNFTPSTVDGYSALVTGERGNTSDAKTTTNNLEILTKAAGQTISQAIYGSDAYAQIVRAHKSHSGSWSYNYPILNTTSGSSASAENPAGCPAGPTHAAAVLADGVTMSGSIDCDENNPYIDQEAKECGEDEEDCTPQKELSHYQWTETYYTVGTRTAYWTINDFNDETGDFANYWTTPSSGGTASTSVSVNIPYNYINSISVAFANGNIYSGETFGVNQATATVSKRNNAATHGEYATITPTTTAKLYVFHSDKDLTGINAGSSSGQGDCTRYSAIGGHDCMIAKTETKVLNSGMNMDGSSDDTFFAGQSYNVYDLKAGEYMCIGSSIWPSASASDTDMSSTGNNTSAYSTPVCQRVFKRPTFQIWNGGLYSAGKIVANAFTKNALQEYIAYTPSGTTNGQRTFSSWIEQGIVANKGVVGLASGAATGFTSNRDGTAANNPGGISGTDFCDMSTLTIPNTSCRNFNGVNFVSAGLQRAKNTIYDTIYNAIVNGRTYKAVSGSVNLTDANNYSETTPGMRYTESSDNSPLTISASSPLTRNLSHVIHAKGNLIIASDLVYDNSISYTTSSQVPQYMIFADGDININCGVGKIDAWLVARGTINTCADVEADDVNNAARSNQLFVRGVLIADKLELTRTYGASTGKDSAIPAEIFLLSAENRFFGKSSSSEDPTLYTVYLRELSPRY